MFFKSEIYLWEYVRLTFVLLLLFFFPEWIVNFLNNQSEEILKRLNTDEVNTFNVISSLHVIFSHLCFKSIFPWGGILYLLSDPHMSLNRKNIYLELQG